MALCTSGIRACLNLCGDLKGIWSLIFLLHNHRCTFERVSWKDLRLHGYTAPVCLILADIFLGLFPSLHFMLSCHNIYLRVWIENASLSLPCFPPQINPRLPALPFSCHCQCLPSCRAFPASKQVQECECPLPPLPPFSTQCSTSPVLPHLNSW